MSKWQCYSDRKAFVGHTLNLLRNSVPEEEQHLLNAVQDSWAHCAPEAAHLMWRKIFDTMASNFQQVQEGEVHHNALKIYNTRYKEFRNKWYNDKSDGGTTLEDERLCNTTSEVGGR